MSQSRREQLINEVIDNDVPVVGFIQRSGPGTSLLAGSWDLTSYSFQCGFEALWDLAVADQRGLLELPLLSIWRQSLELALKSSLVQIDEPIAQRSGHNLRALFDSLKDRAFREGLSLDDELTQSVEEMIKFTQFFDPSSDRFRYPADRKGKPFDGTDVDLEKLYKVHWIITTYCEGVVVELGDQFGVGHL